MADTSLARHAGRFVWLDLDVDKPANKSFLARHGISGTPCFFVLDPADERVTASQLGGMTLPELGRFFDQGERGVRGGSNPPAEAALMRGDEMLGLGRLPDAVAAYRQALQLATADWPRRSHTVAALTRALMANRQPQACAELAAAEAPAMRRERDFASVVLCGFASANGGRTADWAQAARKILEPLAVEAAALPTALRDDRFQLYQQFMRVAEVQGDTLTVARWSHKWLDEIDATVPANDDERSALDIARVDAASGPDDVARILPALIASTQAMPKNYSAFLRLAEMQNEAKRYDDAVAACDRGLASVTGPLGRCWILGIKADALTGKGDTVGARRALEAALQAAQAIAIPRNRDANVQRITRRLAGTAPMAMH